MPNSEIEKSVMALEHVVKWTEGKQPKKNNYRKRQDRERSDMINL